MKGVLGSRSLPLLRQWMARWGSPGGHRANGVRGVQEFQGRGERGLALIATEALWGRGGGGESP